MAPSLQLSKLKTWRNKETERKPRTIHGFRYMEKVDRDNVFEWIIWNTRGHGKQIRKAILQRYYKISFPLRLYKECLCNNKNI